MDRRKFNTAPVETRFKPGQSGNPEGGRKHNPVKRALRNLTIETYREVIEVVVSGNEAELQRMIDDPSISVLQRGIAIAFRNAMNAGDYATVERIAERIVGKIPEELKVYSRNTNLNANTNIDDAKVKAVIDLLESEY